MKLALFLAASVTSAAFAGTVNSPYQVGTWQGFRTAAVSYTFDDNCGNQYSVAVPMFNAKGFKLTLFTVSNWAGDWSAVKTAASYGHEIASHSVGHPDFNSSSTDQTAECRDSQSAINSNVSNQKCVTLAYPYCSVGNESITSQYYIAGRGCWGVESSTPADFMSIASVICGDGANMDLNGSADSAAGSGGWCVYLLHGIDGDGAYPLSSSALQSSVNYMDSNRGKFWVQTFGNVVRYIRERNDVSVSETASSSSSLTVSVTGSLDSSIYNFPITIRRPLPSGWTTASAAQGGKDLGAQIVSVNGTQYVMFDAVPNGGSVTIASGSIVSGVVFYADYNYGGSASQALGVGSYTLSQLAAKGVVNDWASSVRVPSGYTVKMYANDNFSGTSWTLTADQSNFGSLGANDQVSSVVVTASITGTKKIVARHSGKVMCAYGGQTANGTQIHQWSYINSSYTDQQWTVSDTGSGNYKIINVKSGKALDISAGGTANETKVQLWDDYGNTAQRYKLTATDSGYYRITPNCATGSCLDVNGVSTADGAKVQLWQSNGGSNQQWAFQAP